MRLALYDNVTLPKVTRTIKFLARPSRGQPDVWVLKTGPNASKMVAELEPNNVLRVYAQVLKKQEVDMVKKEFSTLSSSTWYEN